MRFCWNCHGSAQPEQQGSTSECPYALGTQFISDVLIRRMSVARRAARYTVGGVGVPGDRARRGQWCRVRLRAGAVAGDPRAGTRPPQPGCRLHHQDSRSRAGDAGAGRGALRRPNRDPSGVREGELSGLLLVTFAGLGALPVIAGLAAIRELARTMHGTVGEQLEDVLTLRRLLAGLLAALGAQVALATLALGAALQLGSQPASSAAVVVFGAASSVLVAVAYAPAEGALRAAARALCRTVVPLPEVSPAELPARAEDRRRLEQALGVDRGLFADLQSGVIVIAPLLASAAAAFLPD
jgi:hypothetical protein